MVRFCEATFSLLKCNFMEVLNQKFNDFIQSRKVTNTRVGDFIADAAADRRLPPIENWKQLKSYLAGKHPDVIDAAYGAWRAYLTAKREQKRQLSVYLLLLAAA